MKRILIIDDAEFARMVLREMLSGKGYEVCGEAESGAEGIEKFKQLKPDLTICDMRMHGMSGADCIKQILTEDPDAKVLVCAADTPGEKMEDVIRLGVKGIVNKPVHIEGLTKAVKAALEPSSECGIYKKLMEDRATAEGIGLNALLDFHAAFRSICGFPLDDPKADKAYLEANAEELFVGIRALLSAKVPLTQLNKLEKIFKELSSVSE